MSFVRENAHFLLPNSQVKSPGFLLKDKKECQDSSPKEKEIQNLLARFRALEKSSRQSVHDLPIIPGEKPSSFAEETNPLEWFLQSHSDNEIRGPGRLKSKTEDMSVLLYKAREVLKAFNIELVIHNSKSSSKIRSLLEVLIPEICFFPYDFYESLNIKNIVIAMGCDDNLQKETCFFLNELETPEKVRQRFYKMIFDHLMIAKGDLLRRWQECRFEQEGTSVDNLETVFIALMTASNNLSLKAQAKKLREFLKNIYPEAMSESQFKLKAKQQKKLLKVRFDDLVLVN